MIGEELQIVFKALWEQGWSKSRLSREFGVNRRTVRRAIERPDAPAYGPRAHPAALSEELLAFVRRRLEVCGEIRATTLFREVVDLGYAGSYPTFARQVRQLRPRAEREPLVRFETDPGVQVQIDWAELGVFALERERITLYALVAILGFSRMPAIRFAVNKTRATTLTLIPDLLHLLGGAPREVLSDRDPALVIGQTPSGAAVFASEWIDLADRLAVTARACRPYRAQTKGKVERIIREVKEDFVPWLSGQPMPPRPALADYDAAALRWTQTVITSRRHRTTQRIIGEAWQQEAELLRPIPERLRVTVAPIVEARIIDLAALRNLGDVEHRSLDVYGQVSR